MTYCEKAQMQELSTIYYILQIDTSQNAQYHLPPLAPPLFCFPAVYILPCTLYSPHCSILTLWFLWFLTVLFTVYEHLHFYISLVTTRKQTSCLVSIHLFPFWLFDSWLSLPVQVLTLPMWFRCVWGNGSMPTHNIYCIHTVIVQTQGTVGLWLYLRILWRFQ